MSPQGTRTICRLRVLTAGTCQLLVLTSPAAGGTEHVLSEQSGCRCKATTPFHPMMWSGGPALCCPPSWATWGQEEKGGVSASGRDMLWMAHCRMPSKECWEREA